jgi:hypothetical protein
VNGVMNFKSIKSRCSRGKKAKRLVAFQKIGNIFGDNSVLNDESCFLGLQACSEKLAIAAG